MHRRRRVGVLCIEVEAHPDEDNRQLCSTSKRHASAGLQAVPSSTTSRDRNRSVDERVAPSARPMASVFDL